jgi:uncharacterized membrane protein YtjA (UPF0391 family)
MTLHSWAVVFLMNFLVTAALAFTDLVEGVAGIAKILFYICVVVCAGLLFAELVAFWHRVQASLYRDTWHTDW